MAVRFLWRWRQEWLGLPVALAVFILSPIALLLIDPRAGIWDAGTLYSLSVASVQLIVINTVARIGAAVNFNFIFGCDHKENAGCRLWYAAMFAFYFVGCLALVIAL